MFVLVTIVLIAQNSNDTLNKFNSKNKKDGYWTFYFDSLFNRCEISNAKYYGYVYYNNGTATVEPIGRLGKKDNIFYKPYSDTNYDRNPVLLNGEIFHYSLYDSIKKCDIYDAYKNGRQTTGIQYFNMRGESFPEVDTYYFDSLCQNNSNSILFYKKDKDILIYKQYLNYGKSQNSTERIYFVKHKEFKSINKIIIGGCFSAEQSTDKPLKTKIFAEIGIAKKFISGTHIDTTAKTYKDNPAAFQSLNFSLQGSLTNKQNCLAQKITYSYTLLFIRGEVGLINYTDFKRIDPRLTFGAGITVFGYFNEMLHFSIPLTKNKFADVPQLSFSIIFN